MEQDCIFCKIANGHIPSATVYEDEMFRVILDLSPATNGHALVLPKRHFRNIFDIDETTASRLFVVAAKVARAMKKSLGCEGLNIVQNNEEIAGQTVFHFHLHIIPRYADDGQKILWNPGTSDPEVQKEIACKISEALDADK